MNRAKPHLFILSRGLSGLRRLPALPTRAPFTVLGIESSCDDTCVAIVRSDRKVLADIRYGQNEIHEPLGGITPRVAVQYHSRNLPLALQDALDAAAMGLEDVDVVAATKGPGLLACLSVGLCSAKALAATHRKPFLAIHHMQAHALTARLTEPQLEFPFFSMLISGGHTQILVVEDVNTYYQLGTCLDDSIGEAFDKVCRMLKLPWLPGISGGPGAALEELAKKGNPKKYALPIPMQRQTESIDFSFAGLKSAVLKWVERIDLEADNNRADLAASFQQAASSHLVTNMKRALALCRADPKMSSVRNFVVSGGVARNQLIRTRLTGLAEDHKLNIFFPPTTYCTDNAVMIAWHGVERVLKGEQDNFEVDIDARLPFPTYHFPVKLADLMKKKEEKAAATPATTAAAAVAATEKS